MFHSMPLSRSPKWIAGLAIAVLTVAMGRTSQAQYYVLDPDASYLDISISAPTFSSTAQATGSDRLSFSGTLYTDQTGGELDILATSDLDALLFNGGSTNLSPGSGGVPPTSPADAGLIVRQLGFNIGSAALRDIGVELTGGPMTITSGSFDPQPITATLLSGSTLDYDVSPFLLPSLVGSADLENESGDNETTTGGTLTDMGGGIEQIFIPLSFVIPIDADGVTIDVVLSGQLTGYTVGELRMIPEPGTLVLLGTAMAGLVPLSVRRLRKRRQQLV